MSSMRWRRCIFRTPLQHIRNSSTAYILLFLSPDETHVAVVGSKWFVTVLATAFRCVSVAVYQCDDIEYHHEDEQHGDEDYGHSADEARLRRFLQRRRKLRWRYAI